MQMVMNGNEKRCRQHSRITSSITVFDISIFPMAGKKGEWEVNREKIMSIYKKHRMFALKLVVWQEHAMI